MKNRLLFYLIALFSIAGYAQNATIINRGTVNSLDNYLGGISAAKTFQVPEGDHGSLYPNVPMARRLQINTTTGKLEFYYGGTWQDAGGLVDAIPTDGSNNAVTSNGVFDALAGKFNQPTGTTSQYIRGDGSLATLPSGGSGTVTSVTGVTGRTTVANGTTTPVVNIDPDYDAARDAYANSRVTQTITNGVTTTAPSEDAVFDALALKGSGTVTSVSGTANQFTVATGTTTPVISFATAAINNMLRSSTRSFYENAGTINTGSSTISQLQSLTASAAVVGTDGSFTFSPGIIAQMPSGKATSITQDNRLFSNIDWTYGDSFFAAFGLTTGSEGFVNKLTNTKGWTKVGIDGTSGATVISKWKGLYQTLNSELRFIGLGVNDMRLYGTTAATPYSILLRGLILSSYASEATKGQQMTLSGTDWTNDTLQADSTTGVTTTTTGATATFTRNGSAIYLTIAYVPSGTATYTVTVDGVSQGTFTADSGVFTGYPAPTGGSTLAYYPYTHRFSGFTNEPHTVVVTKTGGATALRIIGALSNLGLRSNMTNNGISQYVFSVWRMNATGYASFGGSDAAVAAFNVAGLGVVNELSNDGLQVEYLDADSVCSPNIPAYIQADGLHRSKDGHTAIANYVINRIGNYDLRNRNYFYNQLQPALATKVSFSDLGNYVDITSTQTITGIKKFTLSPWMPNILNAIGSNTQGTLAQSSSTDGWGFVRSATTGNVGYAQFANGSFTGKIFAFKNSAGTTIASVDYTGTIQAANAVNSNDVVTLGQMNQRSVTMVAAAYTILPTDYYVELTSGTFTITLPTAVGVTGKEYVIKNGNTGVLTLATTSTQTIDGTTTKTYNSQYSGVRVISNGTNWRVNGSF